MARVTVEDCIKKVTNRFDLVLLSGHRVQMIKAGSPILIERQRDKNHVIALREIADSVIAAEDLRENLIHSMQKYVEVDEVDATDSELEDSFGSAEHMRLLQGGDICDEKDDVIKPSIAEEELLRSMRETK